MTTGAAPTTRETRSPGRLHVYLAAAPGAGKTLAMLKRGRRLADSGLDVIIGWVETHGRGDTEAALEGIERVPPRMRSHRGAQFGELDVERVLARRPDVVLIDELAHTNVPGSRHTKRWQDVEELLQAGIDVVTDLNVQHIDSLASTVTAITGVPQHETVPDAVVRAATTIELVDVSPEELRERVARGAVHGAGDVDTALGGYFSASNLAALRELATAWIAQHRATDAATDRFPIVPSGPVVAALTGAPEGDHVLRRAADLARLTDTFVIGVHVREPSGLAESESLWLHNQRRLLTELGGRYAEVPGVDVARAVLEFARAEEAAHLVLGATRRSRRDELMHGSVVNRALRDAGPIEVHVVPSLERSALRAAPRSRERPTRFMLPPQRRLLGWILGLCAPVAVAVALVPFRSSLGLAGALFCVLLAVVATAVVGGLAPAGVATLVAFLAADFFFTRPYYSLRVNRLIDLVALIAFAAVAGVIGVLVDVLARNGVTVAGATAQAEALARLAADRVAGVEEGAALTADIRRTFALDAVVIFRREGPAWCVASATGAPLPATPDAASRHAELPDGRVLAFVGDLPSTTSSALLDAFVGELRLAAAATQLDRLERRHAADR